MVHTATSPVQPTPHAARRRRTAARCAVGVTLLAGIAACGSSSTSSSTDSAGGQGGNTASIKNFAFAPGSLSVKAGTSVTWTNQDSTTHTVTADDKSFDSQNLGQGKTFSFTFTKTGTVKYHCDIHQYMTGTVTVTG